VLSILAFAPVGEDGEVIDLINDRSFKEDSFNMYCDNIELNRKAKKISKTINRYQISVDKSWHD